MFYEPFIRRAAGLGAGTYERDPDRYETRHEFADVLVVGSGPAGLAAALAAGRSGARVVLVEQDSLAGGSLLSEPLAGPFEAWRAERLAELDALHNVSIRLRTTALGLYDGNTVGAGGAAGPSPARSGQGRGAPDRRHAPRHAPSCWRRARPSGRSSSPTTTGPASCWPRRCAPISIASPSRPPAARCSPPTTTPPIARPSIWRRRALP